MFASAVVDEGSLALADGPGADAGWLDDPLSEAWWDPADDGAEPVVDVSADVEVLLPRASIGLAPAAAVLPASASAAGDREVESQWARVPWLSASCLEAIAPGAGLAGALERVDLPSADDELVVEFVAAAERLAAWAHLIAAEGAAQLSRRASMNPLWREPAPSRTCVAGDELAMRLGWSRPAANRLVRDGRALEAELLPVADAVRAGVVDSSKLRVLTDRLHDRAYQLTWPALEQVLPQAATRTPTQLAADIDRALLAIDPEDAALRLPKAIAARHVCHPRRLPDGMAGLWAVLPAIDAARIDGTLEATARAARALGDPRTLDQLRADTLVDLATGTALLAGAMQGDADGITSPRGSADSGAAALRSVGTGDGEAAPRHAGLAGAPARRRTGCGDGVAAIAAASAGVFGPHQGVEDAGLEPDRNPLPEGLGVPPEAEGSPPGRRAPGIRVPKVRIDVTVALSPLVGLDDQPAELAGLGPIPAEQARALTAGGIWRRIVTDPLTGAVLDVGRTRYRPPRPLAEHVLARDGVCAAPGCSVPGHRCDLDHTTEYYGVPANGSLERGKTSAANLGPLSDRCHRLKTDGGFTLTQVQPGVFEWRTPAGLAYRVTPGDFGRTKKLPKRSTLPDEPAF